MSSWEKVVPDAELKDDCAYFLADQWTNGHGTISFNYYSQYLSGKMGWSVKPGIAVKVGGAEMRKILERDRPRIPGLCALEIPKDAHKRWRARK